MADKNIQMTQRNANNDDWDNINPKTIAANVIFADGNSAESHSADYTKQIPYATTTGTVNTYVIASPTISALTVGMAVSVKFNIDSTGVSTLNWDSKGAKGIKKSNGTDVINLKATGIYTLRYDGTNFILQGEGGSGNAIASDLLTGKTASTDAGDIIGTMTNNASPTTTLTTQGGTKVVPAGYTVGGTVTALLPVKSGQTISPSGIDQAIPSGYYDGSVGSGKVNKLICSSGVNPLLMSSPLKTPTATTTPTKVKEILINIGGIVTVKYDFRNGGNPLTGYSNIYINGVARGTQRTKTDITFTTYTENFTINAGDLIQIYQWSADAFTNTQVQNFIVCGIISGFSFGTTTLD